VSSSLVLSCIFLYDFILNIIMFLVCSSSIFDIVLIDNEFMYMFAKRLALVARGLSGRLHVSMVLRCRLPANAPYWPGRVVDHESDSFVESYIVHPRLIGHAEQYYVGKHAMFWFPSVMFLIHR
jgi:hypothetical protein